MRRTKLKTKSKMPISKLQRKLWELCKQIVRKKYGNTCYTCGRIGLSGSNWQTGHMWAKASVGARLKYDLRILRPQCSVCNLFYGGQGAMFYKKMLETEGKEYMEQLEKDRQVLVRAYDHYASLIPQYESLIENLSKTPYNAVSGHTGAL